LFCAAQGIDLRLKSAGRPLAHGRGTGPVYRRIREVVPFIERDQYMKNYLDEVRRIVDNFGRE